MFEVCVHMTAEYVNHLVNSLQLCARSNKTCNELDCKLCSLVRLLRSLKHASGETKVVQRW